jgi:hypothetical protein
MRYEPPHLVEPSYIEGNFKGCRKTQRSSETEYRADSYDFQWESFDELLGLIDENFRQSDIRQMNH